jgi:hypothetical protein
MLRVLWDQLKFLEAQLAKLDVQIQERIEEYQEALTLCTTIPEIEEVASANLIAEIGTNMDQFPYCSPLRQLGEHLARQPRECRQTTVRQAPQRKCVVTPQSLPGGLGGFPHQSDLFVGSILPLSRAQGKEARHCSGRP